LQEGTNLEVGSHDAVTGILPGMYFRWKASFTKKSIKWLSAVIRITFMDHSQTLTLDKMKYKLGHHKSSIAKSGVKVNKIELRQLANNLANETMDQS
jgi:hypothetical protein